MAYFIIDKQPVFLSWARDQVLTNEALRDKDALFRVRSAISGHREAEESRKLRYATLKAKNSNDPVRFYDEWVKFDLIDKEASENVWDLLFDYSRLYGYAYLSDLRDWATHFVEDHMGYDWTYPMGRTFGFNHFVGPFRWRWRYTRGMKGRVVSVKIVSDDVFRLAGDLTYFTVFSKGFSIKCSKDFEITPAGERDVGPRFSSLPD